MFFQLFFKHHEMKPAVKDPVIQVNGPEAVPPAEMVGDQK
jgi:hypothetical protein